MAAANVEKESVFKIYKRRFKNVNNSPDEPVDVLTSEGKVYPEHSLCNYNNTLPFSVLYISFSPFISVVTFEKSQHFKRNDIDLQYECHYYF